MRRAFIAVVVLLSAGAARAQPSIVGDWEGTLKAGATELHLALHVTVTASGELQGKLDSIEQGAVGIPTSAIALTDSHLVVRVAAIGGTYDGTISADGTAIEGTWSQGGGSAPLLFKRGAPRAAPLRPQTPVKPYPYREEEVSYENAAAHISLAATLTVPAGAGPFPAVLLITGSGPQDRDESILGHRPFLVLADYLTRRGIAVLRADDRGVGKSGGTFATATTADFATDAEAGIAYLRSRREVEVKKIGLIGHSEGGVIAPMIAARDRRIAFVVMMAGTGVIGEDVLVEQNVLIFETMGATHEQALARAGQIRAVLAIMRQDGSELDRETKVRALLAGQAPEAQITAQLRALSTPWFRQFLTYDPAPALKQLTCPVLAINGERDVQVPPKQNLPAIRAAFAASGNTHTEVIELPGLNHLFQTAKTGSPNEYAQLEETIAPAALETIARWIAKQ